MLGGLFGKKGPNPKLVITADDKPDVRDLVRAVLESMNFEVQQGKNGKEAVELVRKEIPGLVILDIEMPFMTGLQALEVLKNDPETKDIPVLMATANQTGADVEKAFSLGAAGYVIKPIRVEQLKKKVREILGIR